MKHILYNFKFHSFKILAFILIISLSACVSQKKKGEVTKIGKFYHNTTALYNGYFNANELVMISTQSLKEGYSENYNKLLPIYPEFSNPNPESVKENLNKAIGKVSLVANIHEPSHWVDDCYLLVGKAQFLMQDYETAEESLTYFVEEFDPGNTKRKSTNKAKSVKADKTSSKDSAKAKREKKAREKEIKKRKKRRNSKKRGKKKRPVREPEPEEEIKEAIAEKPTVDQSTTESNVKATFVSNTPEDPSIFKHESAYPEGLLWLARASVKREKFSSTNYLLTKITEQGTVNDDIISEIPVVKAYSSIEQKKYSEAIKFLEEAVLLQKDKDRKARIQFILAQLYERNGDSQNAYEAYNKVIKLRPDFILQFNAELSLLKNSSDAAGVERRLEQMLKEEKYNKFQDQIYFTLAEIKYAKPAIAEAIPLYQKSIRFGKNNNSQLIESYYKLATIFYDKENYLMSSNYYDSTATVITEIDERYLEVKLYSDNLEDIAKNIEIVKLQDSLLMISAMTFEEKKEIAMALRKAELESAIAEEKNANKLQQLKNPLSQSSIPVLGSVPSLFFAYNESKRKQGKTAFDKEWGIRNLEDDWRRSNKSFGGNTAQIAGNKVRISLTESEVDEILKDVPISPSDKSKARKSIEDALFQLGILYRNKIENYNKAVESHETLITRYPTTQSLEETYFNLYLNYTDLKNSVKAQEYLDKMIAEFPDSKFTKSITDESYVKEQMKLINAQETRYSEVYQDFENGNYAQVLEKIEQSEKDFEENKYSAKYGLLKAMSLGKIEGKEAYIQSLKDLIAKHPNSNETTRAKEILRFLQGDTNAFADEDKEKVNLFNIEEDKLHYVIIIIFDKDSDKMRDAKINISDYNNRLHSAKNYKLSSSMLDTKVGSQVILLRRWDNQSQAMNYYSEVVKNAENFITSDIEYVVFPVTHQNYRQIMKQRTITNYEVWFNENYLNK